MSLELAKFKQMRPGGKLPTRAYSSAGYDLYSAAEPFILRPGETKLVGLGIACEFSSDYVALFRDRSSVAKAGVTVLGGVVDSDYRGEWLVTLHNTRRPSWLGWLYRLLEPITGSVEPGSLIVEQGNRVAQVLFLPIGRPECQWCQELAPSSRGQSGYGSSGGSPIFNTGGIENGL